MYFLWQLETKLATGYLDKTLSYFLLYLLVTNTGNTQHLSQVEITKTVILM